MEKCRFTFLLLLFIIAGISGCGGSGSGSGSGSDSSSSASIAASTDPVRITDNEIVAASCSYSAVQNAVLAAKPGDTVRVPAGTAVWTSALLITKGLKLQGEGQGNTIINSGSNPLIEYRHANNTLNETLCITGFTFDAGDSNLNGKGMITAGNSYSASTTLIVESNTFRNVAASGRGLYLSGTIYGVADKNTFDRVAIVLGTYGNDYASWANQEQAYGNEQNFYFEDNIIKFSSFFPTGYSGWMESGQGGRVVVRYNTWDYSNAASPEEFWDLHGLQTPLTGTQGCQNYSTMVAEYYGNKIINQLNAYRWMAQRGGWLLMFFNSLSGNTNPYNGVTQYFCNSCQATGSFDQKVTNSYYWRNLANGSEKPAIIYSPGTGYGCDSDPIIENMDFYNYTEAFNGSSGVGCGTLAQRPVSCTAGVSYWATNQSCSNLSGIVGANPTTPVSGTLYKCSAQNTWVAYYTPYTYPHPLRTH